MGYMIREDQMPAFLTLMDAINRGRALFWTGNVLVEFDPDFIPCGPVTMVLDQDDYAKLKEIYDARR